LQIKYLSLKTASYLRQLQSTLSSWSSAWPICAAHGSTAAGAHAHRGGSVATGRDEHAVPVPRTMTTGESYLFHGPVVFGNDGRVCEKSVVRRVLSRCMTLITTEFKDTGKLL
jgi:hypothetical protein